MGFGMSFHKCNITGELIDIRDSEYFFFSYYEGSILSLDVDHSGQQGILLNSSIVSILQKLDTGLLDDNSSFNISSSDTFTIHDFLSRYFSIHSHKIYMEDNASWSYHIIWIRILFFKSFLLCF